MSVESIKAWLFKGKRKIISVPLVAGLFLWIWPFALGFFSGKWAFQKIKHPKFKYGTVGVIVLLTLFFGSSWVSALNSPTPSKQEITTTTPAPTPTSTQAVEVKSVESKSEVTPTPTQEKQNRLEGMQEAKVVKVIDGDTVDVSFSGKTERIRVIGVNTPETVDPRKPVECMGERASKLAKETLTTGKIIWLEVDPTQGERDKYSRLLRFIWLDDESDYGLTMIKLGLAYEYTYNTPYKYRDVYKAAQQEAEKNAEGLWEEGACPIVTPTPTKKITTTPTKTQTYTPPSSNGSCKYSCSSPDRDCSDFSSHAEAQTFFNCCGFSATNDPMKLDSVGVGDGVACESI